MGMSPHHLVRIGDVLSAVQGEPAHRQVLYGAYGLISKGVSAAEFCRNLRETLDSDWGLVTGRGKAVPGLVYLTISIGPAGSYEDLPM
jgi:hypothetical protein